MVTGTERKALKTVGKEDGRTSTRLVSRQLGIDPAYARVLCMNLMKDDYLDQETHGHFQITVKGQKALGWDSGTRRTQSPGGGTGKAQVEEFHWRSFSAARAVKSDCAAVFFKPGQEEIPWHAVCVGNNGCIRVNGGNGTVSFSVMTETSYVCGFCRGSGQRQKGVRCQVCKGTGSVSVVPPAVICAYCKGTGEAQRRTPLKCTVCGGKGVVAVSSPATSCIRCRGTGEDPNSKLPCMACQGKGVVRVKNNGNRAQTSRD